MDEDQVSLFSLAFSLFDFDFHFDFHFPLLVILWLMSLDE